VVGHTEEKAGGGEGIFCQSAVGMMGHLGAEATYYFGVITSLVNRLAVSDDIPDLKN
jgi:hypothetical protein